MTRIGIIPITIIDDFWEPQYLVPTIRHRILSYSWLYQWHSHTVFVQRSWVEFLVCSSMHHHLLALARMSHWFCNWESSKIKFQYLGIVSIIAHNLWVKLNWYSQHTSHMGYWHSKPQLMIRINDKSFQNRRDVVTVPYSAFLSCMYMTLLPPQSCVGMFWVPVWINFDE
jgi:hypothetical protein